MTAPRTQSPSGSSSHWSTLQKVVSGLAALLGSTAAIIGALAALGAFGASEDENETPQSLAAVPISMQVESATSWTRFTKLNVRTVPPDTRIQLRCDGGGCFEGTRERYVPGGSEIVFLATQVPRRLKPGAVLEVRLVKPDYVGKIVRYRVLRRKVPDSSVRCLPPGEAEVIC